MYRELGCTTNRSRRCQLPLDHSQEQSSVLSQRLVFRVQGLTQGCQGLGAQPGEVFGGFFPLQGSLVAEGLNPFREGSFSLAIRVCGRAENCQQHGGQTNKTHDTVKLQIP